MWIVRDIAFSSAALHFSSSGQPDRTVTQIVADGVVFANAAELTRWDEGSVQVIVCEACGYEQCQSGGWFAPRQAGELMVFVPLFDEMLEGGWERTEYAPPQYTESRGVPAFTRAVAEELRRQCPQLPAATRLPLLSGAELVRCVQWAALMGILGTFPDQVRLRRELLAAVSEDDQDEAVARLSAVVRELLGAPTVELRQDDGQAHITFYLDGPGFPSWSPIVHSADGDAFSPAPGWVATVAPAG